MIFFDSATQQFKVHTHTATYLNSQDNLERIKYTSNKPYWVSFVEKWGSNLEFHNINLTVEQEDRLSLLNQQPQRCSQWDYQASLYVQYGAILPHEDAPYLAALASEHEDDTLAWASAEYGQTFRTMQELEIYLSTSEIA